MLYPNKNKFEILNVLSALEKISSCPMLYRSAQFVSFLEAVTGGSLECLILKQQNMIYAALPYMRKEVKSVNSFVLNSLPWYGSHGGCVLAKDIDKKSQIQSRKILLKGYFNQVMEPKVSFATLITTHDEEQKVNGLYNKILKPNKVEKRNGQITILPINFSNVDNAIFEIVTQKNRNIIRKSLKQGFKEELDDKPWMWNFLYKTHKENMDAVGGRSKPESHFKALQKHLDKKKISLSVATLGGEPVAALLLVKYGNWIEYITPVVKKKYRSLQPLSFLIWCAMTRSLKEGYRYWNWGGTWHSQTSLHHFKKGWGAMDNEYKYYIHAKENHYDLFKRYGNEMCPYFYVNPYI